MVDEKQAANSPSPPRASPLRFVVVVVATIALVVVLVWALAGSGEFLSALLSLEPRWVGISVLASAVSVLLSVERWRILLRALGYRLPFGRVLSAVLASWPWGVITPSRLNDFLRVVAVRDLLPMETGVGSVVVEKLVDVLVLFVLVLVATLAGGMWLWSLAALALILVEICCVAVGVLARERLRRMALFAKRERLLSAFTLGVSALRRSPVYTVSLFSTSLSIRLLTVVMVYALLVAGGQTITFTTTLELWPIAVFAGLLPLTLGGMGTRDAAFVGLLALSGAAFSEASVLVATLGYAVVSNWLVAAVGLPFMMKEGLRGSGVVALKKT